MERREPLRADPEKVRAFMQRGREKAELKRSGIKRSSAKRKVAPIEGPLDPAEWRVQVSSASERKCIVTGARARDANDRRFHAHHPLPKGILRDRGLHAYVWDARNGAWVTASVHWQHEHGNERIPRERLPASVWEFCAELDELAGTEWATALVERKHPAAGSSRVDG